ncbi:aldehyde dehydrogenase family protein [Gordonia neofelifaecis]|uniref:Aldehyde dehydrogenase n=1 Tax=Gordonia neofelifaecis NRRL B-59395 TaxID=644548 RepID=F1YHY5_9ACTN|nr:aldehyde dehydrogenase family protein [Gordonia neofelifaecis]EGD55539.1 aldehyde dehydrogenase [Gordonia neofelifaecis NRRL B-59395]
MTDYTKLYIGGQWVDSAGERLIDVINPATEEVIAAVPAGTAADVDAAVAAARAAFDGWWRTPVAERAALLRDVGNRLTESSADLANLISEEMGSPTWFAGAVQMGMPINSFRHAADVAEAFEFETQQGNSTIVREPIGVVGAITPWNYPLHQIAAKTAYALAGGNTVVVKPSEVAPLDAWRLAEIFDEAGLPPGVFNLVSGTGPVVGNAIAAHPDIDAVSFTGSTAAGKLVAKAAADTVKRVALELGGKSPNVVLPDADLAEVMPAAIAGAMINSGQTCAALTRLVVPRERLAEVEELAATIAETFTVGDPKADGVRLGPLVSSAQLDRVRAYIDGGVAQGAKLVTGGSAPVDGLDRGYYVQPTVFSEVTRDMDIHREEIFGPVLSIIAYDTIDEAVEIANDTVYGLSGAVWSADEKVARGVARRIRTGQVAINGGAFNPNAPFGGYKQSGVGRELGEHGLEEFLETKSLQL